MADEWRDCGPVIVHEAEAPSDELLIVCNVCHRPVERAAKLYGMELVNRGIFQQWRHNGEVVIKIECHGERYAVSNQLGPVDFDYMPSGPGR